MNLPFFGRLLHFLPTSANYWRENFWREIFLAGKFLAENFWRENFWRESFWQENFCLQILHFFFTTNVRLIVVVVVMFSAYKCRSSFLTSLFSYFWQQTWQQMFSSLSTLVIFHEQLKNVYHFFINWCCWCCCCRCCPCCCCCCPWVFVGRCFYHRKSLF